MKKKKKVVLPEVKPLKWSMKYRCNICGKINDTKDCCGKQDCTARIVTE